MKRIVSFAVVLILFIAAFPTSTIGSIGEDQERVMTFQFTFPDPIFEPSPLSLFLEENITSVTIPGCEMIERYPFPCLPTKLVKILLPPYYKVKEIPQNPSPYPSFRPPGSPISIVDMIGYPFPLNQPYDIEVEYSEVKTYQQKDIGTIEMALSDYKMLGLEGIYLRILGDGVVTIVDSSDSLFGHPNLYDSGAPSFLEQYEMLINAFLKKYPSMYPPEPYNYMNVYYKRGFPILLLYVHPMRYDLVNHTLYFYKKLTLKIHLVKDSSMGINNLYRGLEEDFEEIARTVDNPEILYEYRNLGIEPSCDSGGKLAIVLSREIRGIADNDNHPVVERLRYIHSHYQNIPTILAYVEGIILPTNNPDPPIVYIRGPTPFGPNKDIISSLTVVGSKPKPDHIRELIKVLYKNGVDYVLLLGDDDYNWDILAPEIFRGPKEWYKMFLDAYEKASEAAGRDIGDWLPPPPPQSNRDDRFEMPTYQLYFSTFADYMPIVSWETCFLAGTEVLMADGSYKNIEDIEVGDIVKALNTETGEITDRIVTRIYHHSPEEMSDYYMIINDCLGVTPNHPLYTTEGWKYAYQLRLGDRLSSGNGYVEVKSLKKVYERVPTYNLEVEGEHTYLVKVSGHPVAVHNKQQQIAGEAIKKIKRISELDGVSIVMDIDQNHVHQSDNLVGALSSYLPDGDQPANTMPVENNDDSDEDIDVTLLHTVWGVYSFPWTTASDLPYACLDGYAENVDPSEFHYMLLIDPALELLDSCLFKVSDDVHHDKFDDPFAEVYVGRLPINSYGELSRAVDKIEEMLRDESNRDSSVINIGEYLGFGGEAEYGSYSMDELIGNCSKHGWSTRGIPLNYTVSKIYETEQEYLKATDILSEIFSKRPVLINHLGHSSEYMSMRFYVPYFYFNGERIDYEKMLLAHPEVMKYLKPVTNLTNEDPFIVYSQGCLAGAFDWEESIAEWMVLSTPGGAVAGIWNTMFGFGTLGSTDGPSQRYHREFIDAIFGEGRERIGEANMDSKEDNIGRMLLSDIPMRILYYGINLLGDPLVEIESSGGQITDIGSSDQFGDINNNPQERTEKNTERSYNIDDMKEKTTYRDETPYIDRSDIIDRNEQVENENHEKTPNDTPTKDNDSKNHTSVVSKPPSGDNDIKDRSKSRRERLREWIREMIYMLMERIGKREGLSRLLERLS